MWEIFEKLCKEKCVTPYRVAQDTGVTTATLTNWKKGKYTPKREKMQTLADYFGVTVDYLMTGKEKILNEMYSDENAELLLSISRKINSDSEFKQSVISLMTGVEYIKKYYGLSENDKAVVNNMIDFFSNKKAGIDN